MNKERLLKLADFLESVPRRQFKLDTWVQRMPTKPEGEREGSCGFAGCAIGWAMHAKLFKGFRFDPTDDDGNPAPVYQGEYAFGAIDKLFSISCRDSHWLFIAEEYPNNRATPKQVAARIRQFVASGTP